MFEVDERLSTFTSVARFTWKEYGISLPELKVMLPEQFFKLQEIMYITYDYERADHKDTEALNKGR